VNILPLFIVKKEVFEWIRTGLKTVEIRKGKAKAGEWAIFQCGRSIIKRRIITKVEGELLFLLRNFAFKEIIPTAESVEEAQAYIQSLYGTTDRIFTAYQFATTQVEK
jgi:ASC-1-like (ASCH) protein